MSDVRLASVSRDARLTFIYAITQADDIGLLAAAHRQLLGQLYPLDDDVTVPMLLGWIEELVAAGLVRWRSTRDGVPVLQIPNWAKHQRIDNAGRSQLGPLLVESPDEPPPIAELRREPPRTAASRGLDLRPPTTDLVPPIPDHRPPTDAAAGGGVSMQSIVALVSATNRGLAVHKKRPQTTDPIVATSGKAREAVEVILGSSVPQAFAESALYELAANHTSETPVRSLLYFARAVVRKWDEYQASEAARSTNIPPPLPKRDANGPLSDPTILALERWKAETDAKERKNA